MVIAVDIDEVLFPFVANLLLWHNQEYGTNLVFEDFFSYNFPQVWGGTRDEAIHKVKLFNKTKVLLSGAPINGAVEAIERLAKDHQLEIVTSRRHSEMEVSQQWVNHYFPNFFDNIHTGNHYEPGAIGIPKPVMCKQIGAEVLIDDSLDYAKECAKEGVKVFLFGNYPWNQAEVLPLNVTRVNNWRELLAFF